MMKEHLKRFLVPGLILLLALGLYMRSMDAPLQWDEKEFITDNPIVQDLGYFAHPSRAEGFRWHGAFVNRYVTYLTFALNYSMHGTSVLGYHVVNLLIHILTAWALYWMVVQIFRTPRMSESTLDGRWVAMWSALIFAAHPLATEAVTYVFQRHASLVALFYITSIALYLRWRLKSEWWAYAGAIIVALISMKTKENAFTLPVVIALAEFVFFSGEWKRRIAYLIPLALTMLVVPLTLSGTEGGIASVVDVAREQARLGSGEYALAQPRVMMTYLRLFLLPVNQNIDYDYPTDGAIVLPLIILAALFALGVWLMLRGRAELALAGFGIGWFFIAHLVESSVIALPMLINEYRMYLPGAGLIIACVIGLSRAIEDRALLQRAMTVILIMLSLLTFMRNEVWRGDVRLWEDVVAKSPNKARGHANIGSALVRAGRHIEAVDALKRCLSIDPYHVDAHVNITAAYSRTDQDSLAEYHAREALRLNPYHYVAHYNLGLIYMKLGLNDLAREEFRTAIRLNPAYNDPKMFLRYLDSGNLGR